MRRHPGVSSHQVAEANEVDTQGADFDTLVAELERLQRDGAIVLVPGRGWDLPERCSYRVGTLRADRRGRGFVRSAQEDEDDIYVPQEDTADAYNGDLVLVCLTRDGRRQRLREAYVVEVVERTRRLVRGTFAATRGRQDEKRGGRRSKRRIECAGVIVPDDRDAATDIAIPADLSRDIADGQRALVRLVSGSDGGKPRGEVVVVLEGEGTIECDLTIVTAEFDLPGPHAPDVEAAAAECTPFAIGRGGESSGQGARRDLRDLQLFTIDPADAQDFDDAVSLERLGADAIRLGVHIADVSWYVKPGSRLDRAAEDRGTSIYLPGRVIPMLPERLSNDLCSLRSLEDRPAKSVFLTYAADGTLGEVEVVRSVIRSVRRFAYDEVQAVLDDVTGVRQAATVPADASEYAEALASMAQLRDRLQEARRQRGGLFLEIPQLHLELSPQGDVTGIGRYERSGSHELIEEFMLAANEAVAEFFVAHDLPIVGRAHPAPDADRIEELRELVEAVGFELRGGDRPQDLQRLVDEVIDTPMSAAVQVALLRTMGHAEYIAGVALHYALATKAYCHFTSPIRRYPDLVIHQVLDDYLDGALSRRGGAARRQELGERVEAVAAPASAAERRAEGAERAMGQMGLIRFLEPRVGEEMDAWVVSVKQFGLFVRVVDSPIEGLVHVATLDEYYEYDEVRHTLSARRGRKVHRIGDRVRVELSGLDVNARLISFRLADE